MSHSHERIVDDAPVVICSNCEEEIAGVKEIICIRCARQMAQNSYREGYEDGQEVVDYR